MAGYYNKNPQYDYSVEIQKAMNRGDWTAVERLRTERQNKIDDRYGGNDPYRGTVDIMGRGTSRPAAGPAQTPFQTTGSALPDWDQMEAWASAPVDSGSPVRVDTPPVPSYTPPPPAYMPDPPAYTPAVSPRPVLPPVPQPDFDVEIESAEPYLRELHRKRLEAQETRLRTAYEENTAAVRAEEALLQTLYDQRRNQAAAEQELERQKLSELGVAQGLNTGTMGQIALGQSTAYQGTLSALRGREDADRAEHARNLRELTEKYHNALNEARTSEDAQLSESLYKEKVRQISQRERLEQERRRYQETTAREERRYQETAAREERRYQEQAARDERQYREQLARDERRYQEAAAREARQRQDAALRDARRYQMERSKEMQRRREAAYRDARDRQKELERRQYQQTEQKRKAAEEQRKQAERKQTADRRALETRARTLAAYGDFSGYAALGYTQAEVQRMTAVWRQQHTPKSSGGSSRSSSHSSHSSHRSHRSHSSGRSHKSGKSSSSASKPKTTRDIPYRPDSNQPLREESYRRMVGFLRTNLYSGNFTAARDVISDYWGDLNSQQREEVKNIYHLYERNQKKRGRS